MFTRRSFTNKMYDTYVRVHKKTNILPIVQGFLKVYGGLVVVLLPWLI